MAESRMRSSLVSVVVIIVVCCFCTTSFAAFQEPVELVKISSIELLPGATAENFTLRVRCSKTVEYSTFWVGGRTFVLDMRNAYTPFRGNAIKEWLGSSVGAVRASQFMEGPVHIARIEVDVSVALSSAVRWTGTDLEVAFKPPGPSVPAAGIWVPPPGTTGTAQQALPDTGVTPPVVQQPPPRTGGRVNPFDPILKPQQDVDRTNTQIRPLPNAEQLILTGISYVEDRPDETVALLRDPQGSNYRLKKGDRVLYGFVSQITEKEIVFSLDVYGRRKEVRLTLKNPQER